MLGRATVRDKRAFADLAMAIDGTRDRVESGSGASKVKQGSTHSPLRVTFVVFKFVLGTGMLSMPRAVADTGAVLFPALLLAFAATTWISCSMLAYALDVAGLAGDRRRPCTLVSDTRPRPPLRPTTTPPAG